MTEEAIREQRARRALKRKGYKLKASKNGYMIIHAVTGSVEAGMYPDMSLEDVERFISE